MQTTQTRGVIADICDAALSGDSSAPRWRKPVSERDAPAGVDRSSWLQGYRHALLMEDARRGPLVETSVDWKARAEQAEGILSHNMALANATTRRTMEERNAIIRKLREKYSAMEIADMVGLTRQRVHQILNEAPLTEETPAPPTAMERHEKLSLNGYQIKTLLDFCDGENECDISIGEFPVTKCVETGEDMPAGLWAWCTDYPEEGRVFLVEEPEIPPENGT